MTTVVFEHGEVVAGKVYKEIKESMDDIWFFETLDRGLRIVTYDHGSYMFPWHRIHVVLDVSVD